MSWMFNFSVINIIKKLLKPLATFVIQFNLSPFAVLLNLFHWRYYSVTLFTMFNFAFILLLYFAIVYCSVASELVLNFPYYYNTIYSALCFAVGSSLFSVKSFNFFGLLAVYIPCLIQLFLSFTLLYLTVKLAWRKFRMCIEIR